MKTLKILGVDYETQGFPAEKTNATEVGAILEELHTLEDKGGGTLDGLPRRTELARFGSLIYDPVYPPQTRDIVELTGITDTMLREKGISPKTAVQEVVKLMSVADLVMAHNVQFDKAVFLEQCRRAEITAPDLPWFCTLRDVNYPKKFTCKKLGHLSLDHGVKMDERNLHRATGDVELMFDLVLGNYHIQDLLDYQNEPKVTVKIDIPAPWNDGGTGRDAALAAGYAWDGTKKVWCKPILKKNFQLEVDAVKYRVSMLQA